MPPHPEHRPPYTDVVDQSLPGIGHRDDLSSQDGARVVVVIHHSGRRDLDVFTSGGEEPDNAVTLTDSLVASGAAR